MMEMETSTMTESKSTGVRANIYLNPDLLANMETVFNHLKVLGEIPRNATSMNEYRALIFDYCAKVAVEQIRDIDA